MKFTTKGEIKINVSLLKKLEREDIQGNNLLAAENEKDGNVFIKISVEDTGVGIKP